MCTRSISMLRCFPLVLAQNQLQNWIVCCNQFWIFSISFPPVNPTVDILTVLAEHPQHLFIGNCLQIKMSWIGIFVNSFLSMKLSQWFENCISGYSEGAIGIDGK